MNPKLNSILFVAGLIAVLILMSSCNASRQCVASHKEYIFYRLDSVTNVMQKLTIPEQIIVCDEYN